VSLGTIPLPGDSQAGGRAGESSGLAYPVGERMLQWNPKLVAILVLVVVLAAAIADGFPLPASFGWGA
jgi:hypothetical protein